MNLLYNFSFYNYIQQKFKKKNLIQTIFKRQYYVSMRCVLIKYYNEIVRFLFNPRFLCMPFF